MKKMIRNAVAVSLALAASFCMVSCGDTPEDNTTTTNTTVTTGKVDSNYGRLHPMILPAGTGAEIPKWTVAANGVEGLPDFVTGFLDKDDKGKYTVLNGKTNRTAELKAALADATANNSAFFDDKEVKNVIVVFSDGWGESHRVASSLYYGELIADSLPYHAPVNHDSYVERTSDNDVTPKWTYDVATNDWNISTTLNGEQWKKNEKGEYIFELEEAAGENPNYYIKDGKASAITINTSETDFKTTDSCQGGGAINSGFTSYYSAINCDIHGTEVKNLSELARQKGMLIGNVTNDWLSDATPATVSVHSPKRKDSAILYGRLFLTTPDFCMGNDGGYDEYVDGKTNFTTFGAKASVHLKPWYLANVGTLRTWAQALLREYDAGETIENLDSYNFADWATKRKVLKNNDFVGLMNALGTSTTYRPLGSFGLDHDFEYEDFKANKAAPALAYKLGYGAKALRTDFPNYAEMVASTLSYLDRKAKAENRGFFAFIENTCSDGWGHASRPYDCLNETQIVDEGIAIAIKYVLENPDTLLVITADHETGGLTYKTGWDKVVRDDAGNLTETGYKKVVSTTGGHSSQPIPVFAFGAKAKELWGNDSVFPDTSSWTAADWASYIHGDFYAAAPSQTNSWKTQESVAANDPKFPRVLRNRTTGIRLGKALGFDHFGDLNGNGILDPETESDSVVTYTVSH